MPFRATFSRSSAIRVATAAGILFFVTVGAARADAQRIDTVRQGVIDPGDSVAFGSDSVESSVPIAPVYEFTSRADSLAWARAKAAAERATGFHIRVSLKDRRVWVMSGQDTLLNAPAAVANEETLVYAGRRYTFTMPRGTRTVLRKESDPVWVPPDWHYVEAAAEHSLKVANLTRAPVRLSDGRQIVVRDTLVGLIPRGGTWAPLPLDEHIVFNGTLYIPPIGTANRRIEGQLGKYRLDLGEGFLLHGTPYKDSIGSAATHGCVRLRDEDIEWLFENVPVRTRVYIY